LFRVILGVVVLLVMFWVGVKVGEFKTMIGGGYGGHHAYPVRVYSTDGMMGGQGVQTGVMPVSGSASAPTTGAANAVPVQK
jgi:hypothetical protein